jgi:5-formyltetrahydrofolate cyclo-ligase
MSPDATAAAKRVLRQAALARRAEAHRARAAEAALAVRDRLLRLDLPPGLVVAGYWPMRDELDPRPALAALAERDHALALPAVTMRAAPLAFRRWRAADPLAPDLLGLAAPLPAAETVFPDLLLVPLLAFDRRGHRLGYGAGYYDRSLAALRAERPVRAIGLAYAAQAVDAVPAAAEDQPLDGIVTEEGVLWCRTGGAT